MNNTVTLTINGVTIKCTPEQAIAIATACGTAPQPSKQQKSKGKEAPKKDVEFVKRNGEKVMVSAAQAANYERYRNRKRMTLDEIKATPAPTFTAEVDAFIKANPGVSAKTLRTQFPEMKGMTKQALADRKVALGVRTAK